MPQTLAHWVSHKRQDLLHAIERAKAVGLREGATSADRIKDRILLMFRSKGVRTTEAASRRWPALVGSPESRGSRLSDVAFWTGCEDREGGVRSPEVEDTAAAFLKEYRPRVSAFVKATFTGSDLGFSETVTANTFYNVYWYYWRSNGNAKYLGEARAIGILRTIAHREGIAELRPPGPVVPIDPALDIAAPPEDEPMDEDQAAGLAVALAECFEELPAKCKIVATRRYQHGEKPSAIAEALGVSMGNITNHCNRAVAHLTKCLAAKGYKAAL